MIAGSLADFIAEHLHLLCLENTCELFVLELSNCVKFIVSWPAGRMSDVQ